jgi:hypothetical protein
LALANPPFFHWLRGLREAPSARRRPYLSYRQYWQRVADLVAGHPVVSVRCIGTSGLGEPLWAIERGAGGRVIFVLAGLHAFEHVGPATALALLARADQPRSPWSRCRLVMVPMANPDGFCAAERLLARGGRGFVRCNARGVDLNRNFAVGWNQRYYLNRWLRPLFGAGQGPLSEPETRAIDLLVARERPQFAASLHAFGQYIFYPYACSQLEPPDGDRLRRIATAMAARQPVQRYRVIQLGRRSRWFRACGAEIDHFYGRYGTLSFLVEIGAGPRWNRPADWFVPYTWYTPPAAVLERDMANVIPALDYLAELV